MEKVMMGNLDRHPRASLKIEKYDMPLGKPQIHAWEFAEESARKWVAAMVAKRNPPDGKKEKKISPLAQKCLDAGLARNAVNQYRSRHKEAKDWSINKIIETIQANKRIWNNERGKK